MSRGTEHLGGYSDSIFVGTVPPHLKCGICHLTLKDPFRCANEHSYCRTCFSEHFRVNNKKCPECRVECDLDAPARLANALILALPVQCYEKVNVISPYTTPIKRKKSVGGQNINATASGEGCEWTGPLGELEAHTTVCGFVVVKCSFSDCNIRLQRRRLRDHEDNCPHRLVDCECCYSQIPFNSSDTHKRECPARRVSCTNGCNEVIPLNTMPAHRAMCALEMVACPLKNLMGCNYRCTRDTMPAHSSKSSVHFIGMTQKLIELTRKIDILEASSGATSKAAAAQALNGPNKNIANVGFYKGQFVDDKPHGLGVMRYSYGATYDGDWRIGVRNGLGVMRFSGGDTYEGEWRDDKMNGRGIRRYLTGRTYEGEWRDDKLNGFGLMRWSDGRSYNGEWKDGKKDGHGVYRLSDGQIYDGDFKDNYMNGRGVLRWPDGKIYEGEFINDEMTGSGVTRYEMVDRTTDTISTLSYDS